MVHWYDGIHRFLVDSDGSDSDAGGGQYLVDLAWGEGVGRCGCRDWECRVQKRINSGEKRKHLYDPLFQCKHIKRARAFQYEWLFHLLMEREPPEVTT
jgi:hypothetical protein